MLKYHGNSRMIYVGFLPRIAAAFFDELLLAIVLVPMAYFSGFFSPSDPGDLGLHPFVIWGNLLPLVAILLFWMFKSATPGKMLISAVIVDAETGKEPKLWQFLVRLLGYGLSTLALGFGYLWIAFDPRNQGWHDKLARTVVVRRK
jgi:uncharacterized RDD family membrane protein YckC